MFVWQTVIFVMGAQFLACVSPGPDFAVTVRNAIAYPREIAMMTAIGIAVGCFMHASYCALGLAILLVKFPKLFLLIRYVGGVYLLYLGIKGLLSRHGIVHFHQGVKHAPIPAMRAFRQGFFVNASNPKAIFFIFSLFIVVTKLQSVWWNIYFVFEMAIATLLWFCFLVYCITHPKIKACLVKIQKPIGKCLGIFLIFVGLHLIWG